ncbi:sterile alpha motif domain-containing protein 12-like [Cyrtonyx montezumae]|uniref:sterile alpha motif domain-containing protein 12-like n=1 Tax=Cyrtonyx montezumae TaxID=9017 RepID=UPI0032DB0C63
MEPQVRDGAEVLQEGCLPNEMSQGQCLQPPQQVPPTQWTVQEVCAWLGARHGDLALLAAEHAVTGRALLRLTEGTLQRMGVAPCSRRWELLQELLGLRLQQELEELLSIVGGEQHPQGRGGVPTGGLRSPLSRE